MTEAVIKKRKLSARSTKLRSERLPNVDDKTLRGFPAPTEWSEELIINNMPLAIAMARRMATGTKMPFNDLFGVACLGLIKGCRKYDPALINLESNAPYKLSSIVVPYIRGEMMHYLRDKGFSSGVKFPDKWRDIAPTVRRMVKAGSSLRDVNEATGLSVEEIQEILTAQGCTNLLDPDLKNNLIFKEYEPDELDEVEFYDELAWVLQIADRAHAELSWADRSQIEAQWSSEWNGRRRIRRLATQQHKQFLIKARRITKGEKGSIEEQNALCLELPAAVLNSTEPQGKTVKLTSPKEIIAAVEKQLTMFSSC